VLIARHEPMLAVLNADGTGQPHTFRNKWQPEKRECVEVGELIESWRSIVCPHSLAPQP
jgi:hypothetical protein